MKKQLTVALGLAVLATPAFATKARLQSLGEDVNGSFFVNDNRNIFLNPAQINNHRDLVTFELGDTSTPLDSTATPKAEGGVFKQGGNLVYGVQLGSESNASNHFRTAAGLAGADEENNIDLFVGGDTGLKWGANVTYTSSDKDEAAGAAGTNDPEQSAVRTRMGVIMGDTQVFGGINVTNDAEDAVGSEFEGDLGYRVGVIQAWNGYSIFGDFQSLEAEGEVAGTKSDLKARTINAGIGKVSRLNDRANLYTRVQYSNVDAENEGATAGFGASCNSSLSLNCEEYKASFVPVVAGLEVEATSWLSLRASVQQTVWGSEEDADNERPFGESTVVNAGATLKFGELAVDGVIGNTTGAATGPHTATGAGTLRSDVLMTRVGMTYRF
ncbi:MAG TPA: hypothetical protein VNJ08_06670 [Bacteriovoracaceae bacterium]|nr:hypothetical protein [Bacteriovoracaceae bacterium]